MNSESTILLIEDDVVDMMSVKRALKELQVTNPLTHVENGEEALAFLKNPANVKPAIILLDLNMPKMNGHEFLALMKNDEELKRIPVIVLTTSRGELDKVQSFDNGVAGYMIKPVDYRQFVEVMRTIRLYWTLSELPG
ncbi:response regulator [Methanoregula sp.]|uniref:response regulator n=1 Tax=Methanoregula sp. TaxID=2052170 RepID=UPI00356B09C4